mgnify:CR=1 FL=1
MLIYHNVLLFGEMLSISKNNFRPDVFPCKATNRNNGQILAPRRDGMVGSPPWS